MKPINFTCVEGRLCRISCQANFCPTSIRGTLETSPAVRKYKKEYYSFKRTRSFTATNIHKRKNWENFHKKSIT